MLARLVAKGVSRARVDGVDATPVGFFRDSPAWTNDPSVKSYIDTCQATKVGDAISPTYLNGIITASIVSEAIEAYDANRYRDALELYASAQKTPAGNQLKSTTAFISPTGSSAIATKRRRHSAAWSITG